SGVEWDDVHEEAHRLEHGLSDQLVDRIATVLGEPEACPHGSLIPSRDGSVATRDTISLWDLEPSAWGEVVSIRDEDNKLLRHLAEIGLVPGAKLRVRGRTPYEEGMVVEIGSEREVVGKAVAQAMEVARR
ncbi:MAG: metal-dependent transcriptional regulator, partial [Candidatus Geothermarchaeales archaeon]